MGTPIGIAGAGRVAQALGRLLYLCGNPVVVGSRNLDHARDAAAFIGGGVRAMPLPELLGCADRILIAVSDEAIEELACTLAKAGMRNGIVLHTCGASGPEVLAALAAQGVACGALHPLQTFATAEQGVASLPGAAFALTADGPAAVWGENIAKQLNGRVLRIPASRRTIYHAAAVMGSNYIVALIDAAVSLMQAAGFEEPDARAALGPLVRASVENALQLGAPRALTGPIQRNDIGTVDAHLNALDGNSSLQSVYRALGLYTVDLARRGPASRQDRTGMEALLREGFSA